jgi:hypothetical protein
MLDVLSPEWLDLFYAGWPSWAVWGVWALAFAMPFIVTYLIAEDEARELRDASKTKKS